MASRRNHSFWGFKASTQEALPDKSVDEGEGYVDEVKSASEDGELPLLLSSTTQAACLVLQPAQNVVVSIRLYAMPQNLLIWQNIFPLKK